MDTLTHAMAPFAILTWLRRSNRERAAAALGGAAPDLDFLWAWLSHAHDYAYPLVHRGFSHTLWGAPALGVLLLFLLSRPRLQARWPPLGVISLRPDTVVPLLFGALTHLALDGLTITGIPLFWPLHGERYTFDWFFFGVPYLLPLSLVLWIQIYRRKASDRFVKAGSLVLVLLLASAGAIRYGSYPKDLNGSEDVTPGPVEWNWIVSERNETGVVVYGTTWGGQRVESLFLPEPNRTEAADAVARCQAHIGYTPWAWYLWGLAAVNATRSADGGWTIQFTDSGTAYDETAPSLRFLRSPARSEADFEGGAACVVSPDGQADFRRDRGWLGS